MEQQETRKRKRKDERRRKETFPPMQDPMGAMPKSRSTYLSLSTFFQLELGRTSTSAPPSAKTRLDRGGTLIDSPPLGRRVTTLTHNLSLPPFFCPSYVVGYDYVQSEPHPLRPGHPSAAENVEAPQRPWRRMWRSRQGSLEDHPSYPPSVMSIASETSVSIARKYLLE